METLSLFSTGSEKAGYRLQYMEVYNWGTFHERIFRINPQGNNSLLTGANASGKSTFIDALLTLLVPIKKERFYNQSSGNDKKGDRTEETYVCGHYGNIQHGDELSTSTQKLRDKSTYSVILASFANKDMKIITLFQLRWFTNGELKKAFGLAHLPLEIEKDFNHFDNKGNWKKRLEKQYNGNATKHKIEFFEGPTSYANRIQNLFGMRSQRALSLFNQVVGVKVLDDLDEFIQSSMLEEKDAESEFIQLKTSFLTLMDAKTNIDKAKKQIDLLTPIDEIAVSLEKINSELTGLNHSKKTGDYWFAKKTVELGEKERLSCNSLLKELNKALDDLKLKEKELQNEEVKLRVAIEKDETGNQIAELGKEIERLEKSRDSRKSTLEKYNEIARAVELGTNPSEDTFLYNRKVAKSKKDELEKISEIEAENLRQAKNLKDQIIAKITNLIETIKALQISKSNIPVRTTQIRDDILKHTGASKEEIPFIGELIKLKDEEKEWEKPVEKILHHFASQLIVPEKYYFKVNEYVNSTNLKWRITYQRYKVYASLRSMNTNEIPKNALVNKLEFKKSIYSSWLEDVITSEYNYACVTGLQEFNRYNEMAVTRQGLIKSTGGKHEKDDRPHIGNKENFVLGWDNREKIILLQQELKTLQAAEKEALEGIHAVKKAIKNIEIKAENYSDLFKMYTKYDDINWSYYAEQIVKKEEKKSELEKTNDKVTALQLQLTSVRAELKALQNTDIENKIKQKLNLENKIESITQVIRKNSEKTVSLQDMDFAEFEESFSYLLEIKYAEIETLNREFEAKLWNRISQLQEEKQKNEDEIRLKINSFKLPPEEITSRFKDWRSDVSRLPDSTHLEFVNEYQVFLMKLREDNLPFFEKKFNEYLQETITHKVGDFRMFFENWAASIKENIRLLNASLREINFRDKDFKTYIQLVAPNKINDEVKEFRKLLNEAIPNIHEVDATIDGRKNHFDNHISPLILRLEKEDWRRKVMDVRLWFTYKAEEYYRETQQKFKTYESMGQLSGGEKAQLTYTILGSAIAYQFGLTKHGLQSNSFRFIAIDEAFKAQDEDKARYLITLCKQLHLQLLVVTPSDNIHIVENDISYVHFVERKEEKTSWLYDMPIEQFREERAKFMN